MPCTINLPPSNAKFYQECPFEMKWIISEEKLRKKNDLRSNKFKSMFIPGIQYYLELFPNGQNNKPGVWISLHLKSVIKKISATFVISIESASHSDNTINMEKGIKSYILCSNDDLFNQEKKFIVDGNMLIQIKGTLKALNLRRKSHHCKKKISALADLLVADQNRDFVIAVGEKEINMHKWILEARSPVFKAMFASRMKEAKENKLLIPDFSFEVVKTAMDYLYERDIKSKITEANASEFLHFADKYDIKPLHAMIQKVLIKKLNETNVCQFANASVTSNAHELCEHCTCLIASCMKASEVINEAETLCDEILKQVCQRMLLTTSRNVR